LRTSASQSVAAARASVTSSANVLISGMEAQNPSFCSSL
jgi:hypothetical protein